LCVYFQANPATTSNAAAWANALAAGSDVGGVNYDGSVAMGAGRIFSRGAESRFFQGVTKKIFPGVVNCGEDSF